MPALAYRPEIDGLRAIAVLAVIGFHAGFGFLPGGYLGVDVFFVVSGFVIGSLLKTEFMSGNFSMRSFISRRIRRLAPALIVVIGFSFIYALVVMKPWDMERFSQSVVSIFGVHANLYFKKSTDYFSPTADTQPLLHIWSLSIEEQFYLLLPLLLVALHKLRQQRMIVPILAVVAFASLGLASFYPYKLVATPFYSFETRIWELLAGVLLSHATPLGHRPLAPFTSWLAASGLGLILVPFLLQGFSHVLVLLVVLGTMLVIAATSQGGSVQRILSLPPLVGVGLISYSLYLWHQPVLAFSRLTFHEKASSPPVVSIVLALILILSVLTYIYVEKPFRKPSDGLVPYVVPASFGMAALLAGCALVGDISSGFSSFYLLRQSPDVAARTKIIGNAIASRGSPVRDSNRACIFWSEKMDDVARTRLASCAVVHGPALVVLGDSHAMDLFNAMKETAGAHFVFGLSRGACSPSRFRDTVCPYADFELFLRNDASLVKRVFFTLSGNYYFAELNGSQSANRPLMNGTIEYLQRIGKSVPVLWLGPQYEPGITIEGLNPDLPLETQFKLANIGTFQQRDTLFANLAEQSGVAYFSKINGVVLDANKDFLAGGQLSYSDTDHWSSAGEHLFGERLTALLTKTQNLP